MKHQRSGAVGGEPPVTAKSMDETDDQIEEVGFSHVRKAVASVLASTLKTMFDSAKD
jgi:hypothetical protein